MYITFFYLNVDINIDFYINIFYINIDLLCSLLYKN